MVATVLVLGASGRVGSHVVKELGAHHEGITVRLATSRAAVAEQWRAEGREAVVLDLDRPEGFAEALQGVDRVFLLTGYSSAKLYQSKKFVDAAVDAVAGSLGFHGVKRMSTSVTIGIRIHAAAYTPATSVAVLKRRTHEAVKKTHFPCASAYHRRS